MAEAEAAPAPAPAPAPDAGGKGEETGTKMSGDGKDLPAKRGGIMSCTDPICIPIFTTHVLIFWFLSFQNQTSGDPMKLISPMDFKGDFCGIKSDGQWAGGLKPDYTGHQKLMWAMNLTEAFDSIAKQVVCGSGYGALVSPGLNPLGGIAAANKLTAAEFNSYCGKSGDGGLADAAAAAAALAADTAGKVAAYTDPNEAAKLFTGGGSKAGTSILKQVTKYFVQICSNSCDIDQASAKTSTRSYTYAPAPMAVWGKDPKFRAIDLWTKFAAELTLHQPTMLAQFVFKAWPESACPYKNAKYCVPMPGVSFTEVGNFNMCLPKVDSGVLASVGAEAGKSLEGLAKADVTEKAKKGFDTAIGDILKTWQVFIIVAVLSLVVGLIVLVLMRFVLCPMVWGSLALVFFIFLAGGAAIFVRSTQCADQGFVDAANSHKTAATAAAAAGTAPDVGLTEDASACPGGYAIEGEDGRKYAKYLAYVVFGIAALWLLGVLIMVCRIRLAIAVNQVACMFLYSNPTVLLIPVIQNFIGIIWILVWCYTATFLLSQVGIDQVPGEAFKTYAEAYGTEDVAGKCTNSWPPGIVYVDEGNAACSGVGVTDPACYKCGAPRFWMDYKFGYSFFSFLWHNFFFVAIGQCTIAGAVGIWFFTPSGEKWKKMTVGTALKNTLVYHTGSLAFGSLILAIVVWLKWFMTWLAQQAKQTKNKVMEIVCKILAYCLWCFEKCVKFLNKNAYIQVALMGTNFCKSAKNAFFLILRNILRFGVIAILSHIVHFIGMILIIALTALMGYGILNAMYPEVNPICPTIIYTFIGWMTAKLFIGTFALAVDATLQCVIAAEEMDCGNEFVPGPLKSFIDENAKEGSKCCDTCCCTIM